LAKLAAQIEPSSYIFDTLAESYFVNGMNQEALETAERALKLAKTNRSYYRQQLERFRKAVAK
jgi:hypothetical protein